MIDFNDLISLGKKSRNVQEKSDRKRYQIYTTSTIPLLQESLSVQTL